MAEGLERGEPSKNNVKHETSPQPGTSEKKTRSETQINGYNLMHSIFEAAGEGSEACEVDVAQSLLQDKERKKKKSMGWKVDLEIGPDIKIPTVGYVAIRREAPAPWKRCLAKPSAAFEEDGELKAETTFVRDNEDQEVVENDQLVDAFKYGSKVCPLSEVEKSAGRYVGGPKSLMLIGFVKRYPVQ